MSEKEHTSDPEDLQLEGSEADSVVGGRAAMPSTSERVSTMETEIFRLESEGYVEEACTREGTMFVNPRTGHRVTLKLG
jgi:hypothetical protein